MTALLWTAVNIALIEGFLALRAIWRDRPMVARDWTTGRYRSVRRMARERAR